MDTMSLGMPSAFAAPCTIIAPFGGAPAAVASSQRRHQKEHTAVAGAAVDGQVI